MSLGIRLPRFLSRTGGGGGVLSVATKLFDNVTPSSASLNAAAATHYPIDMAASAGDVVITLQIGAQVGQAVGVELTSTHAQNVLTFAGAVAADMPALNSAGDFALFTFDGTVWQPVSYTASPGWLGTFGGTAVGLYRFQSASNFITDYSGNGRNMTSASPSTSFGYSSKGAVKTVTLDKLGTVNNAAFRLQGAMSVVMFFNPRASAEVSKNFCACGVAGGSGATNLCWSISTQAGGQIRYLAEEGATGNDIQYLPNLGPLQAGWQVLGMTRSAVGQVVRFYSNGALIATSGNLTTPTQGGSSIFAVGADSAGAAAPNADFAQFGVYSVQLTDAQMKLAAQQCLGTQRV